MKVCIIGGGASGIACAIALKKQNKDISVEVFEKLPRALKKVLATGNGRCNLTNVNSSKEYFRGDTSLVEYAFSKYSPQSNMKFFNDMGLLLREENEGRVYPVSGQASSVVNVFLSEIEKLGIKLHTDQAITKITPSKNGFILNKNIFADKVVISCGGSAAKQHGTDGDSFKLIKDLGMRIKEPTPALTGLIADKFPRSLKGIRNICNTKLLIDGKEVYSEKGEVQFNDYGVSGIPIMQLSGLVSESKSKSIALALDTLPDNDEKSLLDFCLRIKNEYPNKLAEDLASGILPKALGNQLLLMCDIKKDTKLCDISKNKIEKFIALIKNWKIRITGVRGFDYAQVTAGGLIENELNKETMEAKKHKSLYVIGEAVNVYGLCGGHNLQWAWSSARLCADAILKEI